MLDADAVINNSSQKVGGSGHRKTHRIYAPDSWDNTGLQQRSNIGSYQLYRQIQLVTYRLSDVATLVK